MYGSSTVRLVNFHTTICRKSPNWSTVRAAVTASEVVPRYVSGSASGPRNIRRSLPEGQLSEHNGQESRQESKMGVR